MLIGLPSQGLSCTKSEINPIWTMWEGLAGSGSQKEIRVTTEEMDGRNQNHKPEAKLLRFCLPPTYKL